MEQSGNQSSRHTGQNGCQQGYGHVRPVGEEHDKNSGACAERTVHRQIGNVQNFVSDVDADGHNAPDQALGYGTGQRVDEIHHDASFPLKKGYRLQQYSKQRRKREALFRRYSDLFARAGKPDQAMAS